MEKRSKDDIKNYILTYYKTVAPTIAEEIATQIMNKSDEHNVPFVALVAVTEAESNFNPFAVSPLKKDPGRGLLQVRYGRWAEKLGLKDQYQLHDIETGVDAGAQILRQLLDDNGGDMKKALWNYVGVTNNVDLGKKYVRQIYENMGNFTVFRSLANQKPEESDSGTSSNVESGTKTYTKPTIGDPGSLPTSVASAKSTGYVLYNIEKGDTLFDIAAKYYNDGNKWKRILDANPGVEELKLVVGSKLMIPNANLNSFRGQNEPN